MALTYEKGALSLKGEIKSGTSMKTGNVWQNQTIVLDIPEYGGQYRKLALKVSGRELEDVQALKVGDIVEVGYKVTSREYNGNWYNDVSLYNIRPAGAQDTAQQARPRQQRQEDNVFNSDTMNPATHEDLPF